MKNRSVPVDTLLPHLVYRDLPSAAGWLTRVLGFTEHFHYGDPVSGIQMVHRGAFLMLSGPREGRDTPATLGYATQMLTIFVPDVDARYAHVRQQRAIIWEELHETVYGEKQFGVEDPEGHRWIISQHARDLDPTEWGATIP